MANPRIPESADPDLKEVLKDLWANIDRLLGSRNVDWHGRRIINAGDAVDLQDYVTLAQLTGEAEAGGGIVQGPPGPSGAPGLPGGTGPPGPPGTVFPVGSVFIATVPTDPATLLGYGVWSAIATGRVLVGIDPAQPEFDTALETGGENEHILVCSEIPECP